MKNFTIIIAISCLFCFNIQAESLERNFKHEAKINMGALIYSTIDISYEFLINDCSGVGMDILAPFQDNFSYVDFRIMPYYRLYFGSKKAAGFFAEINLAAYQNTAFQNNSSYSRYKEFSFGTGIAIGGKFLTKSNFLFEIYGGMGRDFVNNNMYPRCGLTFGKRF